ncbi:potassium transporter TrkA [Nonomuraea sp. MG754425]|uniref:CASTOR/POLLUX-related putative ion channel n=1 Tax=Nonomuraea sp. MG754425 TaxID=2570319 RepID=UPI001F1F6F78|nr:potassium transporter TrkA [Nonomuraea sp. MG754425]MCF6475687.1 potassium transporter TrkA [Nonomuraea sp. MG754425]
MKVRDRLRYWFDRTMDRGTPALIGWLGLCSALMIGVVTILVVLLTNTDTEQNGGWPGVAWMSLLRTLDPGTMGGDEGSALFLSLMLIVTVGGIFIVSALIGVLTTGLEKQIDKLRKGRSRLIERGHTIVLGWSDHVFTVIGELVKANQGERRSCVVVLAEHDKVDMEEQIRARIPDTGKTRVICRSGNPLNRADLELVSPDTAKSIIVLPRAGAEADIDVMKTLLLLNNRVWRPRRPHVVAAVQRTENLAAARLAGGEAALVIDADDIAVRLVVQSHRQAGLSTVCTDLLDFAGNELYLRTEPALTGTTFGEALHAYDLGVPIGLRTADGRTLVNPDMKTLIEPGDQVIVLAEDDLLIRPSSRRPPIREEAVVEAGGRAAEPDRTLLIGWNARGTRIIDLLDRLVEPGSVVDIAAPRRPEEAMGSARANLSVRHKPCRPTSRPSLEQLDLGGYQHIVVLADDEIEPGHADDRTLVTLLHLRDIEERLGDPFSIVTEMHDDQNREVAQVTKADDFIVSSRLISLLLTQLSENRHLHGVFAALFDPSGSEIYLKPAHAYVPAGTTVNFATVLESARRRGESAIGYRLHDHSQDAPTYGVRLNPPKDVDLVLEARDSVIVLAES